MRRKTCAVLSCYNSSSCRDISFFAVAKRSIDVREKWMQFIHTDSGTDHLYVCSDHFTASDFKNASCKSKGLRHFAIPSVNIGTNQVEILNSDDISVAGNEEIGQKGEKRKAAEVVPNNRGLRNKKPRTAKPDHDYACTTDKYNDLLRVVKKLKKENKRLQRKTYSQALTIKRKTASVLLWKNKAKIYRKRKVNKIERLTENIFLELQRNASRARKGARFSAKLKTLALRVYYCSPRAYREMQKVFRLPGISIIKKWLRRVRIDEGFSLNVQTLLREKAAMLSKPERVVSVVIDEMTLRPNLTYHGKAKPDVIKGFPTKLPDKNLNTETAASSVLVIMIKGVRLGFKQTVGYFFSQNGFKTDDLQYIIMKAIEFIEEAGFIPKILICDQNSTNRSLFKKLGATVDKPFFKSNANTIYTMFDTPHLVKSSRNNLMRHNAVYRGAVAKWDDIKALYEEDVQRIPRAAPKLSNKHIYLPAFGEMRVGVAAETLSNAVASAIRMYVNNGILCSDALATAKYAEDMDKLFDCFNSSRNVHKSNKIFATPISKKSPHWKFLDEMSSSLQDIRFIDKNCKTLADETQFKALPKQSRKPWFVEGWLMNINCLRLLYEDLSQHFEIDEIEMSNINQDCLENFFGVIRMANATNNRPDVFAFQAAYRSATVNQLMQLSEKCNSHADAGSDLFQFNDFSQFKLEMVKNDSLTADPNATTILNTNLEEFDSAQLNNISYTAGWISSTITHTECVTNLKCDAALPDDMTALAQLRNSGHQAVSQALMQYLQLIVTSFNENFELLLRESPVGIKLRMAEHVLNTQNFNVLCNHCKVLITDKYLNMLMKAKVKALNENFAATKTAAKKRAKTAGTEKAQKLNIC